MNISKTIQIADATLEDIAEIREVEKTSWLATYPNEKLGITVIDIEERFDENTEEAKKKLEERKNSLNKDSSAHTWIAKDNDRIIGVCIATKEEKNHIQTIYILPEFQGQGVGGKLMSVALDWLGSDKDVFVNSASYNEKALAFYRSFGFVESGEPVKPSVQFSSGASIPEIELVKKQTAIEYLMSLEPKKREIITAGFQQLDKEIKEERLKKLSKSNEKI